MMQKDLAVAWSKVYKRKRKQEHITGDTGVKGTDSGKDCGIAYCNGENGKGKFKRLVWKWRSSILSLQRVIHPVLEVCILHL